MTVVTQAGPSANSRPTTRAPSRGRRPKMQRDPWGGRGGAVPAGLEIPVATLNRLWPRPCRADCIRTGSRAAPSAGDPLRTAHGTPASALSAVERAPRRPSWPWPAPPPRGAAAERRSAPREESACRNRVRTRLGGDFSRGVALLRRRPRRLLRAARQELLDPSKAWWGGRRGRLADRRCCPISVSLGVVPLVLARFVEVPVRIEVAAGS